jgi:hypothetical protein
MHILRSNQLLNCSHDLSMLDAKFLQLWHCPVLAAYNFAVSLLQYFAALP